MKYPDIDTIVQRSLKRLGYDDKWIGFTGGSYETASTVGKYKVEFDTQPNGDVQFILWNPNVPCVTIYIHMDTHIAVLNSLQYSPQCTIDGVMKRGQGTKEMLDFAFRLAKKLGASTIELEDESTILCETGEKIKLGPFYFLRYGITWYEKYFGFRPKSEYVDEYTVAKTLRKEQLDLNDLKAKPCSYFTRKVTDSLLRRVELNFGSIVWEKPL